MRPVFSFSLIVVCLLATAARADENDKTKTKPAEKPQFTEKGHTIDKLELVQKRLKDKEAVLIDVREQDEWNEGHLKQAKLVPLSAIRKDQITKDMLKSLPKDKPIYCHCRSGGRVLVAFKYLKKKGYDIRPLQDGYENLLKAGFEKSEFAVPSPKE
ncbi:MAG: rhodanese-like domain-containing protein [Aureliella sp.]